MVSGIDLAKKDIFGARWVLCSACDPWNMISLAGQGPVRAAAPAGGGCALAQLLMQLWLLLPSHFLSSASMGSSSKPRLAERNQVIAGGEAGSEAKMNPIPVIFFF